MVDVFKEVQGKLVKIGVGNKLTETGLDYGFYYENGRFKLKDKNEKNKGLFDNIDQELKLKFKNYHTKNPGVYKLFLKYVNDLKNAGRRRYSAWAIINRIRWDHDIKTKGDEFKISNDYIALYARLAIYHHPELKDFFIIKKMKHE